MLNFVARILLTATALAPVGLTYAWVAGIQGNIHIALIIAGVSVALVSICAVLIWRAKKSIPATRFKASAIEAADHENTAFLLLYVMPLFAQKFATLEWQFWIPTITIFGIITATGYNYHFNPLLGLMGWHFYKVDSPEGVKFVLITRRQLRTAANEMNVGQLTEYILIDLGV